MKKIVIFAVIIAVIVAVVSIYSCQVRGSGKPDEPVGGLYVGKVAAVVQDPAGYTKIYWEDPGKKPLVVLGLWQLQIGAHYVINCRETPKGLEITGIQIKKQ